MDFLLKFDRPRGFCGRSLDPRAYAYALNFGDRFFKSLDASNLGRFWFRILEMVSVFWLNGEMKTVSICDAEKHQN
ncbi:hypothetical protein RCL_jg19771.t1 [Rhizophagus clarus]|uniref:Uncharacterized protein n=1 Tax=Rhizophagus clarus TaxID=94130 RepID=A0A8H3R2E1_9GLOM|nr:hypothetical protein RCL_jg19771.t1 [Rhizophagus clarus]